MVQSFTVLSELKTWVGAQGCESSVRAQGRKRGGPAEAALPDKAVSFRGADRTWAKCSWHSGKLLALLVLGDCRAYEELEVLPYYFKEG